jgi:hypothetical protein
MMVAMMALITNTNQHCQLNLSVDSQQLHNTSPVIYQ